MAVEEKRKTRVCKCQYDGGPEMVRTVKAAKSRPTLNLFNA
jgi:hypothetical protein